MALKQRKSWRISTNRKNLRNQKKQKDYKIVYVAK